MLLIILCCLLALLGLYLIGRYIPPLAYGIAFVCVVVGKPFVMVELGFKKSYDWCHAVYKNGIENIAKKIEEHSSVGRVILSRIIWLLIALLLLFGETFNSLAAVPALFRISYINLPDWLVVTSAILFLLVPVAFGAIILEMVHAIPLNERLFPPLNWILRLLFGLYALAGLILSVVVIYMFFQFRAVYLDPILRQNISPLELSNLSLVIFGGLGLGLGALGPILWVVIPVGIEVVVILLMGLLSLPCALASFVCSLFARFLEVISLTLSNREISPYDKSPDPIQFTRRPTPYSSQQFAEVVIPPLSTDLEVPMVAMQQFSSIVFGGSFGSQAYETFTYEPLSDKGRKSQSIADSAQSAVLTTAYLDLNSEAKPHGGNRDLSPTDAERHTVLDRMNNKNRAYHDLFEQIGNNQVKVHLSYKGTPAAFLYILDCRVVEYARKMLEDVHDRLPHHALCVFTSVSERDLTDKAVVEGLRILNELHRTGVLATTVVIDPHSPFIRGNGIADEHGEETQLRFALNALVGLLSAHKYSGYGWMNKTSVSILSLLSRYSPFVSLAFASDPFAPGGVLLRWRWLRIFTRKARGGDLGDAETQATRLTRRIISPETPDARAINEAVDIDNYAVLLCHVPFPKSPKFADFSKEYSRRIGGEYSHFAVETVSGNGSSYLQKLPSPFLLQVSCFYPLHSKVFDKMQRLVEAREQAPLLAEPPLPVDKTQDKPEPEQKSEQEELFTLPLNEVVKDEKKQSTA